MAASDKKWLARALDIAKLGEGFVEPNPMVGCVIVKDNKLIGEGRHERFGQAHAEVNALANCSESPGGATAFVTLEPCSHTGKTPPCTGALLNAGVERVVIGALDPSSKCNGKGVTMLQEAGVEVDVADDPSAKDLIAPFSKLVKTGRPWVIAKWAMSLDGKLATRTGDSQWISNERSREVVHAIRGRMDAIMVGGQTARDDDPQLTARPPGARVPHRVVFTSNPDFASGSNLVRSARDVPTTFTYGPAAEDQVINQLAAEGCNVLELPSSEIGMCIEFVLDELGKMEVTNLMVEGGSKLLGCLFQLGQVDEVHVFIAPKIIGGETAVTPVGGEGIELMTFSQNLVHPKIEELDSDVYVSGRLKKAT